MTIRLSAKHNELNDEERKNIESLRKQVDNLSRHLQVGHHLLLCFLLFLNIQFLIVRNLRKSVKKLYRSIEVIYLLQYQ